MRKMLSLGLLMALFIGTASAALFESGTKDAQPMVLYGKYNNTIVPVKVAADGSVGGGGVAGSDTQVQFNDGGAMAGDAGLTYNKTTDVLTAGSFSTASSSDPYTIYDVSTATDTDYWMGAVSNNDGVADDFFQIGTGTVAGTNPIMTLGQKGGLSLGDGSSTSIAIQTYKGQSATNYVETLSSLTGGFQTISSTGLSVPTTGSSNTALVHNITLGSATSSNTVTGTKFVNTLNGTTNSTGTLVGLQSSNSLTNASGTHTVTVGLLSSCTRSAAGTSTTYYGAKLNKCTVSSGAVTENYALNIDGKYLNTVDARTIADSGGAGTATLTLAPTSSHVQITCSDTDGCDITMSETGAVDGTLLTIHNVSANVANFADTSGVSELAGAFAMGQYDTISLQYVSDRWVELSRSNN